MYILLLRFGIAISVIAVLCAVYVDRAAVRYAMYGFAAPLGATCFFYLEKEALKKQWWYWV